MCETYVFLNVFHGNVGKEYVFQIRMWGHECVEAEGGGSGGVEEGEDGWRVL